MATASIEAVDAVRVANRAVVRETSALRTRITAELAAIRLSLHAACFCSLAPLIGAAVNEYLEGGAGDDVLMGRQGGDVLSGGSGNDLIKAGHGRDVITGGDGGDTE